VYLAIADALARDVEAGELAPGDRLPTHRALARRLGVNVVTITRAYAEAARRGLVEGEVGRGTFVRASRRFFRTDFPLEPAGDETIDFHFNVMGVDEEALGIRQLLRELADEDGEVLREGYVSPGYAAHRAAGAEWMARAGLDARPERTLVTVGAQHALTVAFSALAEPGDVVLTEELTYPGVKALAALMHLRTQPVGMDASGLVPEALEDACRRSNAKLLYVTPTLQNPTGCVLSAERREALVRLAEKYDLWIVEDDTTGRIEGAPPPLANLAPARTCYVTSLSKSLVGSLRVGYLHAPALPDGELAERLTASVAATTWMAPPLMAEIATRMIRSGRAEEVVRRKGAEIAARRELLDATLGRLARTGSHPGCSFVWLELPAPWRGSELAREAARRGVAVSPPEAFVVGRASAPHAVRVALGRPRDRDDVRRGLTVLARLLQRAPAALETLV